MASTTYTPRHRAHRFTDSTPDVPCSNAAKGVECGAAWHMCPRHHPVDYAEYMARHATDSIGPLR